jgi:hypothetical protein
VIYYTSVMSVLRIDEQKIEPKALWVECNNPNISTEWKFLWEFDEEELVNTQELIDELNIINAPVQLRIVSNTA